MLAIISLSYCTEIQRWSRGHKARGQGQGHKKILRPRPRTDPLEANAKGKGHRHKCSPKKKVFKIFFQAISKKKFFKNFFQAKKVFKNFFYEETKKRSLQIFRKVSGVSQRNFNGSKIVLSSSRGQANFRGQGLQNVSSRSPLLQSSLLMCLIKT